MWVKRGAHDVACIKGVTRTACDIAHDFANVLSVIRGSADLMKRRIDADHPAAESLDRILLAVQEAATLTGELRAVACNERPADLPWP
jgi:signal transduction histidine kinase